MEGAGRHAADPGQGAARPAGSRHPAQDCQVLQDISQLAAGLYCRVHSPRVQDKVVMPPFDVEVPSGLTYPEYIWCVQYFDTSRVRSAAHRSGLAGHAHLPALVCGLSGRTLTHGEVGGRNSATQY